MKIKFNWGTGIFLYITIFTVGASFLFYKLSQNEVDLVYEDYYPRELKYDETILARKNYKNLKNKVTQFLDDNKIIFCFPKIFKSNIEGEIMFYSPSDLKGDIVYKIKLDKKNCQDIQKKNIKKIKYSIYITWKYDDKRYLYENIFINK